MRQIVVPVKTDVSEFRKKFMEIQKHYPKFRNLNVVFVPCECVLASIDIFSLTPEFVSKIAEKQ